MKKIRLDQYLLNHNLVTSLSHGQSLCIQGLVHDDNTQLLKPGMLVASDRVDIKVKALKTHTYVARSALKLKGALEHFAIAVQDKICLDVGASTGGFTQVLLENQAQLVYAVDVAYGEFASILRTNPCVVLLERVNARHLQRSLVPLPVELVVCDVSFISLTKVLPAAIALMSDCASLVALIKPQFELPKELVGKGGIVRDAQAQEAICQKIASWLQERNFQIHGILSSPLLGSKGNQEFLIYATKSCI
jgi:23S rRNA (cytidine1920-2'-O)/16S rRNA (cytidine1409-2'-O)-methyltransferase